MSLGTSIGRMPPEIYRSALGLGRHTITGVSFEVDVTSMGYGAASR
jgi:hypothetical protein